MTNTVQVVCRAARIRAAHWLSVCVLVLLMHSRTASVSTRQSGSSGAVLADGLPLVRQPLLEPAVQLRGQSREDVFQVGPRLMPASGSHSGCCPAAHRRRPRACRATPRGTRSHTCCLAQTEVEHHAGAMRPCRRYAESLKLLLGSDVSSSFHRLKPFFFDG